jgi:hypothetical protein
MSWGFEVGRVDSRQTDGLMVADPRPRDYEAMTRTIPKPPAR